MIGILIGSFIGFLLVWLIFNLWDQIFNVEPYDIDEDLPEDSTQGIFEAKGNIPR